MRDLQRMYHPITGTPFQADETYREIAPCAALAPYIRCFWGSERPLPERPHAGGIVIPDTCMDIIFGIDYANNHLGCSFCALDEHSYRTAGSGASGGLSATFAIRFYAWSVCLFAEDKLHGSANRQYPADAFFRRIVQQLTPVLFDARTLTDRIHAAEPVLLSMINRDRQDAAVLNAIHRMLRTDGRIRIADAAAALALSPRQLERRFDAMLGVSPKRFASLLRYQLLWQSMVLNPHFNVLDAVDQFGYTDQAHLLHDFRSRHLMSPREALILAGK